MRRIKIYNRSLTREGVLLLWVIAELLVVIGLLVVVAVK